MKPTNQPVQTTPANVLDDTPANTTSSRNTGNKNSSWIAAIIGVLIIAGFGGFIGGLQVGKSSSSNASMSSTGGMGSRGQMGAFGEVTAVDNSSITVKDQMQSSSKTFTIASSTTITDDGTTASVSDISVGDSVMVQTSSDSSSGTATATTIQLNPSMQGGPSGQSSTTSNTRTN